MVEAQIYDLIVLGGGSAGSAAAAQAVKLGLRSVLVVNEGELGGLCILRGCMPTKTFLASSDVLHDIAAAPALGVHADNVRYDFAAIVERKRNLVARFQRAKIGSMESGGYEILDARARFVGPDSIEAGGRVYRAKSFVIATGSRLSVPPIPGLDTIDYLHSDALLELERPPRSLIVHGGGAVGLEFACFFAGLGAKVTLVNRSPLLNRGEDPILSEQLANALGHLGIRVVLGADVVRLEPSGDGVRATIGLPGGNEHLEAERYLLALGREANVEGLDLAAAGIRHARSKLQLDANLRTTNGIVFAAGDATDERQILHTGNMEGRHAAHNAVRIVAGTRPEPWVEKVPLFAIFTHPPYAEAGLTETSARNQGIDVVSVRKNFANQGRGIVMGVQPEASSAKLIGERGSGRLVGAQFLCPRADDLVHVASTVMHFGGGAADLVAMPWYHPTLSEVFVELGRELLAKCLS